MLSLLHRISPFGDSQRGLTAEYVLRGGEVLNQQVNLTLDWHSYYSPNKAVVTTSRIEPFVITHEVYHSLGLPHSFENRNHIPQTLQGGNREIQSNGEYSFGYQMTTNIMDYSDHRNNLFYWQIKIVRSKAAPEPNNYRPEQL